MRNILLFILSSILLISFDSKAQNLNVFWEIKNPENNITSYIIGVKHESCIDDPIDTKIRNQILSVLTKSEVLIQEASNDIPTEEISKLLSIKDGKTLKDIYSKDEYELIKSFCKQQGISLEKGLDKYLPILLKSALIKSFNKKKCLIKKSIETEVLEISKKENKEIINLENATDGLKPFYSIPLEKQKKSLLEFCKDQTGFINLDELYYNSYSIGIQKIYSNYYEYCQFLAGTEFAKSIIDNRNSKWLNTIKRCVKEKSTFIIVGVAHLGSENGIIELLKKSNFKLKNIPLK